MGGKKTSRINFAVILSMSFNVSCSILGIKRKELMKKKLVGGQEKVKAKESFLGTF